VDFLLETAPRLYPNQRAITLMVQALAAPKNTWLYLCQPTGTGKTTEMLEVGYMLGLELLPGGKAEVEVHLVVPSKEQVGLYQ
jgi:hypothetical protein